MPLGLGLIDIALIMVDLEENLKVQIDKSYIDFVGFSFSCTSEKVKI